MYRRLEKFLNKKYKLGEITVKLNKKEVIVYLPFKKETKIKPSKNIMCIDVNSENVTIGIFNQEGEKFIYLLINLIAIT